MSAEIPIASETTHLLDPPTSDPPRERNWILPETLLIPVAIAPGLAGALSTTTFVELVRQTACNLWQASHGDQTTLPTRPISADLCYTPEVERYFSIIVAAIAIVESFLAILACGFISRYSSWNGRKPALFLALVARMLSSCLIIGSQSVPAWLSGWLFLVGILLQPFSSSIAYLINAYTVDICTPENKTASLSKASGWAMLGTCISFATGGFVTTKTGNPLIVFYIAIAIYILILIYVVVILPESLTKEKREALLRLDLEQSNDESSAAFFSSLFSVFGPLKVFTKVDGIRNWRLTLFAVHTLVVTSASAYVGSAWIILVTSKYHLTPADTGLFFTFLSISSGITLTAGLPTLLRFLRPYYNRRIPPSHPEEQCSENDVGASEPETSELLDVHITIVAQSIAGIAFLFAAKATTHEELIITAIVLGLTAVDNPTVSSLVSNSVDPLKQGEALAAFDMLSGIGGCLSTVIMGSILTASIETMPMLIFYIHMAVSIMGSAILFFVREADRYHKPLEL